MAMKKKIKNRGGKKLIGTGLMLAGALGYYLARSTPSARRKLFHTWTGKAKKEAIKRYAQAKVMTEAGYQKAVREVLREYKGIKNIDAKEFSKFGKELKTHWQHIRRSYREGRGTSST